MTLVERLRQRLTMSMFVDRQDLYAAQELQRKEAAARIEELEVVVAAVKRHEDEARIGLREALSTWYTRAISPNDVGDALSIPHDDTALRELIAKERKAALSKAADWFFEEWRGRKAPHEILRAMAEEQGAKE